jgi:hypothetical protein
MPRESALQKQLQLGDSIGRSEACLVCFEDEIVTLTLSVVAVKAQQNRPLQRQVLPWVDESAGTQVSRISPWARPQLVAED